MSGFKIPSGLKFDEREKKEQKDILGGGVGGREGEH